MRLRDYDRTHRKNIERNLKLSTDYEKLFDCEYVAVCVSSGDENKLALGNVRDAVDSYCKIAKRGASVIVYSTLPFGSSRKIKQIIERNCLVCDVDICYVHMPLMVAQGMTADDFVNPPFVAFGSYLPASARGVLEFYKKFIMSSSLWNKRLPPMFVTSPETAEMAKLTANAFLSTKMSFANMADVLCKKVGIDSTELFNIVGSDWRIGHKMLRPGFAWGGNCFPRDLQSLIDTYAEYGVSATLLKAALEMNNTRVIEPYMSLLEKHVSGGPVLVLGLAYKSGIRIKSGSKSLELLHFLQKKGYNVFGYDPGINPGEEQAICKRDYRAIIVTTDESPFGGLIDAIRARNPEVVILDYRMKNISLDLSSSKVQGR